MPGFSFTTIEPNQLGRVTKWDVPINDWLGIKFQSGHSDTLGEAYARATEDFIFDDGKPVTDLDYLNKTYGIEGEGGLKFTVPVSEQRAERLHARKRKELERQAYLDSASHSWFSGKAAAGFGAALIGGMSSPIDLGLSFLPFIGSEKAAASVAKLGGAAWRQSLARGVIAEERLAGVVPFHRLSAAVIDGVVNQAIMEIPIAIQKHRDQANYGLTDSAFNVLAGGAFAGALKGLGLALERAGKLWREADPRIREAAIQDTVRSMMTGEPPRAHWASGLDEATIRAKVEERVRAENPFDEAGVIGTRPLTEQATPATATELIAQAKRGEFPGWLTPSDATIVNRLIKRLDEGERSPALFETLAAYLEKSYDAAGSLKALRTELFNTIQAISKTEPLLESDSLTIRQTAQANIAKLEAKRNVLADEIASNEAAARQQESLTESTRQQSIEDFLTKAKAEHEAKVKGIIDAETQKAIAEIRQQHPSPPKEQTERYTFKEVPDDANIKAVDEDTATLQEQVLNVAKTPEERLALEAEIKAGLKELEEKGVSGEKAVDAMIPCVVAKAKL